MSSVPRVVSPSRTVLWPQIWGLAAVQGAITLSWVIYNLYLLQLLTQYGFSAALATGLIVLETGAAVVLEPLMGSLSDQTQRWVGSRFPFVAVGVILASICFLAIPVSLFSGGLTPTTRWLLPIAMVLWALSMTVFRSPVLSLLGRYAIATRQPQAASILTLVGGVAGAVAPLTGDLILQVGPLLAFSLGSVVLLGSAFVLRLTNPDQVFQGAQSSDAPKQRLSPLSLLSIFGTGFSVTLGLQSLLRTFPVALSALTENPKLIMGLVFIAIAGLAFPAGILARRFGMFMGMAAGLGLLALLSLGVIAVGTPGLAVLLAVAIGSSISLISNCTIPIALAAVPPDRGGLGTGLYFGGAALATSVFSGVIAPADLGLGAVLTLGAIAFLVAIALIQPIRLAHQD
ncbi:MAG: MFS transporter [Elainellaceae cyanobacterium]